MIRVKKKFMALALAIAMVLALIPGVGGIANVEAASVLETRIYDLYNKIAANGGHFTITAGPTDSYDSGDLSYNESVIASSWLQNALGIGSISIDQLPTHGNITRRAWQCAGFANFAEWYIFKNSNSDYISTDLVATTGFSYSELAPILQTGDAIRLLNGDVHSHSAIVISVTGSGINVLDCNWDHECGVQIHEIGWGCSYPGGVMVSRCPNSPEPLPDPPLNRGDSFVAAICHPASGNRYLKEYDGHVVNEAGDLKESRSWWKFKRNANGSYTITNQKIGSNIDDQNFGTSNGSPVMMCSANGSTAQNWFIYDAGNGKVFLEPQCARGMMMDIGGDASGSGGTNVHLWSYSSDNDNQKFTLVTDDKKPTISNVKVSEVSSKGYKVECDVSDNYGILKVAMPTWTAKDDQDDLVRPWDVHYEVPVSGGHASYYVNVADHNNESGTYITHIYAYDYAGNSLCYDKTVVEVPVPGDVYSTDLVKPAQVIDQGDNLSFGGTLKSEMNISNVTIGVYQNQDSGSQKILEKIITPDAKSCEISESLLNCSSLAPGGYTFKITGTTSVQTSVLVEQPLLVKAKESTIPGGEYVAKVAGNTDVVISVANGSTENGANVEAATYNGEEYQKFLVDYLADGYYSIVNTNSGMALAVKNAGTTSGTTIIQATKNTSDAAQRWQILPTAGDTYCLVPECATGLVADLYGGKCQAGDNINISTMHLGSNQRFFLEPTVRCEKHTWNSGKLIKAATCTEDGEMKYTCTVCKYSEIRTITAPGHTLSDGVVLRQYSRFEEGLGEATCTTCGETVQYVIKPPLPWSEEIILDNSSLNMVVGKEATLQATLSPEECMETEILWTSSDENVATVSADGKVTAVSAGEATITASAMDSFPPTTEYRYKTITGYETKTTTEEGSLGDDWEYVDEETTTTYGEWGPWSSWSTSVPNPGASDTRQVEKRNIAATYKTQYDYDKWAQYSDGTGWSGPWEGYWSGIYCGNYTRRGWSDTKLDIYTTDGDILFYGRSGDTWYNEYSQQVQVTAARTEYRYRDRTKTVTTIYTYQRPIWSDWSAWSAETVEPADDIQIETRDVSGAGIATVKATCEVKVVLVGWITVGGNTYYYTQAGEKVTGIQKISGKYYLFNGDGILQYGLSELSGKKYYTNSDGVIQTGVQVIDKKKYYFNAGGVMQTGWLSKNGVKYYFDPTTGAMATGLQTIDGKKYLFNSDGTMFTGIKKSNGKVYFFGTDGAMRKGWLSKDGKRYYFDATTGAMQTGTVKIDGKVYVFGTNGVMKTGWLSNNGKKYYFDPKSGVMVTGVQTIDGKKYYFNSSGVMQTGWMTSKNKKYYFDTDGAMVTGIKVIDGVKFVFASTGELITVIEA